MNSLFVLLAFAASMTGCGAVDSMKSGFAHSQEVAADLAKSLGTKPAVGFNWSNGSLVNVSVNFNGIPSGRSVEQIVGLSRDSIAMRFEHAPKNVVVSFTVPWE